MGLMKKCALRVESLEDRSLMSANVVVEWNETLLQSLVNQPPRVPLARNLALVHTAMFDAVNAIDKSYEPYAADVHASSGASQVAAVAQAAHDTLVALYPSRQSIYDAQLAADLEGIPQGLAMQGVAIGQEVARQILALRSTDGSATIMTWEPPDDDPGTYQLTGPNFAAAGNVHVPFITPFAIKSNIQFRAGEHPALDSPEYARDLNEVKLVGASDGDTADRNGDGVADRTADQTLVAELWRVALGNHTVWNRIAQKQADIHDLNLVDTARLFALLDMSINDSLQTSNESKYHFELWRPITAIQRADDDGNPETVGESTWMTEHPTTPPYPAYTSNASSIGATSATVLVDFFGDIPFEYDWGTSLGGLRSYDGFWDAADEMADARIYGGIHFRFDCVAGQQIGRDVGGYILSNRLQPLEDGDDDDQLMAASAATTTVNRSLRAGQVQPVLNAALARWQAAGVDTSALGNIDVRIADLGGLTLGQAADGVITLDNNAAGWGWFVDRTARNDSEFTRRGNQGEKNRMDLLTVLTHEVGHLLGYDHDAGGVMQETLDAGIRRTMGPATFTLSDRPGGSPTLFSWSADTPWINYGLGDNKKK